ncbi:MAG: alanine racemase [Actinobacteria bacterium]|nr:MAG: alanine racemase [Actinomycetota bacterium]
MDRSTWVEVDVSALKHNFGLVSEHAGVPVCAVVKANGYGHGLVIAARAFARTAAMLAVTRIEEATALREAGVDARILILAPVTDPRKAMKLDCEISVGSPAQVANVPAGARAHLIVDTGMGRLGLSEEDVVDAARAVGARATLGSVWTHFADAAGHSGPGQLARFESVVRALRTAGISAPVHAANSAATLALPRARFDMVRVGTLLCGQDPPGARAPWTPRDPFAWYARVIAVRTIPAGATVGYGSEWRAKRATRAATLPVGYVDGFLLEPAARTESVKESARAAARVASRAAGVRESLRAVFFGERRAPVVGRIGMQLVTVDVTSIPDVEEGSIARVPGRRLLVDPSIERVAVADG